jgi:hypothetical protein
VRQCSHRSAEEWLEKPDTAQKEGGDHAIDDDGVHAGSLLCSGLCSTEGECGVRKEVLWSDVYSGGGVVRPALRASCVLYVIHG